MDVSKVVLTGVEENSSISIDTIETKETTMIEELNLNLVNSIQQQRESTNKIISNIAKSETMSGKNQQTASSPSKATTINNNNRKRKLIPQLPIVRLYDFIEIMMRMFEDLNVQYIDGSNMKKLKSINTRRGVEYYVKLQCLKHDKNEKPKKITKRNSDVNGNGSSSVFITPPDSPPLQQQQQQTSMDCESVGVIEEDELQHQQNKPQYTDDNASKLLNHVYDILCLELEKQNAIFHFSKEALKFFLVTHSRFLKPSDFINTNEIGNNNNDGGNGGGKFDKKSNKNVTMLTCGNILNEYCKDLEKVISNLQRTEQSDIDALKLIVNYKLSLPSIMYTVKNKIQIPSVSYEYAKEDNKKPDHVFIPITSFKRATILVTVDTVLLYDNNFIVPSNNIEKDFTATILQNSKLKAAEYMVLDISLGVKCKVIDLLATNYNEEPENENERISWKTRYTHKTVLPSCYDDRIAMVHDILPNVKTVNFHTYEQHVKNVNETNALEDFSYIQKPRNGQPTDTSYIYIKPNLTAAVIGIQDINVCLAFIDVEKKQFHVKTKAVLSGPALFDLGTTPMQKKKINEDNNDKTIRYGGEIYGLVGDLKSVELFQYVIPIILKDNNKIGAISDRMISTLSEYASIFNTKNQNIIQLHTTDMQDPQQMSNFINSIREFAKLNPDFHKNLLSMMQDIDTKNKINFSFN